MFRNTLIILIAAVFALSLMACPANQQAKPDQPGEKGQDLLHSQMTGPGYELKDFEGPDTSVPPEEGGIGFENLDNLEADGWLTNTGFEQYGDPRAVKGGQMSWWITEFPSTLRVEGMDSNNAFNSIVQGMCYEGLMSLHPTTLEYIPAVASHWKIEEDEESQKFTFRINPKAAWADGKPVTAEDVVATWDFMMDEGLVMPSNVTVYGKYDRPVAESKYIVSVKCNQKSWRNFLYFGVSMYLYPAHVLRQDVGDEYESFGEKYVKEYNFMYMPGSGPYVVNIEDIQQDVSLTATRRTNYWGWDEETNVGQYNVDKFKAIVIKDPVLAFEKVKKGELDFFYIPKAEWWAKELEIDNIKRGLIQKRKIFTQAPNGTSGFAYNMREEPFNDINVRLAFQHLLHRQEMIEKLFFNEYIPIDSYWPGGIYENPNNPVRRYDPDKAVEYLEKAGWMQANRNERGILVKDGQEFQVELPYASQLSEPYLTMFQEDCKQVGIDLQLKLMTGATLWQLNMERKFKLTSFAWTGLVFPNPETSYKGDLAYTDHNNNFSGVDHPRINELLPIYDNTFDQQERINIIQEIDYILATEVVPYCLSWYGGNQRFIYWNKFGHPDNYLPRTSTYRVIPALWWVDPAKEAKLKEAMEDESIQLEVGPSEVHPWEEL